MSLRQYYLDQVQRVDDSIIVLSAGCPAPLPNPNEKNLVSLLSFASTTFLIDCH